MQAKFELIELSERKAKLVARLLRVETRAQTYRRLLRQALEEVRALEDSKSSLSLSCNKVCSEMGAVRAEHEHLQKTHAGARHRCARRRLCAEADEKKVKGECEVVKMELQTLTHEVNLLNKCRGLQRAGAASTQIRGKRRGRGRIRQRA